MSVDRAPRVGGWDRCAGCGHTAVEHAWFPPRGLGACTVCDCQRFTGKTP